MSKEIKKVISLAKRTGDRIVVFDPEEGGENFVIISLEEYENLLNKSGNLESEINKQDEVKNLTENELIDKINRNIAIWKNENKDKELDSYKIIETVLQTDLKDANSGNDIDERADDEYEEDNLYYYEEDSNKGVQEKGRSWDIPLDVKKGAEEVKE